jgi:hypothetical protein
MPFWKVNTLNVPYSVNIRKTVIFCLSALVFVSLNPNYFLYLRINEIMDEKGSELADLYNPFPPEKLAEQFKDLFNTAYKESFEFYITKLKKTEKDAAGRLLQILYVIYYPIKN